MQLHLIQPVHILFCCFRSPSINWSLISRSKAFLQACRAFLRTWWVTAKTISPSSPSWPLCYFWDAFFCHLEQRFLGRRTYGRGHPSTHRYYVFHLLGVAIISHWYHFFLWWRDLAFKLNCPAIRTFRETVMLYQPLIWGSSAHCRSATFW